MGSLVGGALALDTEAAFQFMISRPLVCGPVIGLLLGDVGTGLAIGAILELLNSGNLLVGGRTPPDASLATAVATSIVLMDKSYLGSDAKNSLLGLSIIYSFYMGILAGRLEHLFKTKVNVWFLRRARSYAEDGRLSELARLNWEGLGLRYFKNFSLAFVSALVGFYPIRAVVSLMPPWSEGLWRSLYLILPFVGLGAALKAFGMDRLFWFLPVGFTATLFLGSLGRMDIATTIILASAAGLSALLLLRFTFGLTFPPGGRRQQGGG